MKDEVNYMNKNSRTFSGIIIGFMIAVIATNMYLSFQIRDMASKVKNLNAVNEYIPDTVSDVLSMFGIVAFLSLLEILVIDDVGIVYMYSDKVNKVSVCFTEEGKILSLKVLSKNESEIERIRKLACASEFSFKRINDGYVLEPR